MAGVSAFGVWCLVLLDNDGRPPFANRATATALNGRARLIPLVQRISLRVAPDFREDSRRYCFGARRNGEARSVARFKPWAARPRVPSAVSAADLEEIHSPSYGQSLHRISRTSSITPPLRSWPDYAVYRHHNQDARPDSKQIAATAQR